MVQERARRATIEDSFLDIVSQSETGAFTLRLPPFLSKNQQELELLLSKVFTGRPTSPQNLALARQLSLNWAVSKCRQAGVSIEEIF